MNFNIIIFLFSLFFTNNLIGQSGKPSFKQLTYKLEIDITEEIYAEAESKGIDNDCVIISFDMASDCQIENFMIIKSGVLKNCNLEVEKQKNLIIKQIKEKIKCEVKKLTHYVHPIYIQIN